MNRKDLINSFESLTPSDFQKSKILNNVLNTEKKQYIHKSNYKYVFTTAAAAVCIAAVTVAVTPLYRFNKLSEPPLKETSLSEFSVEDAADKSAENSDVISDETSDMKKNITNDKEFSDSESAFNEQIKQSEAGNTESVNLQSEEIITESVTDNIDENYLSDSAKKSYNADVLEDETGDYPVAARGVYRVGGAHEEITLEQYYAYLGVNVDRIVNIPEGYTNKTKHSAFIDMEYDDTWLFEYTKGEKYIQIITTKDTKLISYNMSGLVSRSTINGKKTAVVKDGLLYTAYIISNNIAYTINAYDVSESDLNNLLLSITK